MRILSSTGRSLRGLLLGIVLPLVPLLFCINPAALSWAETASPLQSVDQTPLGNRTPLVLIHGINPRKSEAYSWKGFLQAAKRQNTFRQRYKPYLFIYAPEQSVRDNGRKLALALQEYETQHPEAPPFRFAALSLGGLILKEALEDPQLWAKTDRIIALGVPFHGTPLADPPWIQSHLKTHPFFNPIRRSSGLAYRITEHKFPHFRNDFCWDNFDGSLPDAVTARQPCLKAASTHRPEEDQAKYIVYAGFFNAPAEARQWLLAQSQQLQEPGRALPLKRGNPFSRHILFHLITPCLSRLTPFPKESIPTPFAFNDGISPISSQLWLGRRVARNRSGAFVSPESQWASVFTLAENDHARLFEGLDHRDWLDNTTRYRGGKRPLPDLLHPQEQSHGIYDWIIQDLSN